VTVAEINSELERILLSYPGDRCPVLKDIAALLDQQKVSVE
jgi:hypothetical protein